MNLLLSRQNLALSVTDAVSGKGGMGPSPILLCSWGCNPGEAAWELPLLLPPHPSTLGSLALAPWPSPTQILQSQSGWCWRRSPLLKKWKRKWTKPLSGCPLVPHWLNPGCQKAAQEESHFKKQLRELKLSYSTILDSGPPLLPWPTQTVFICPL